MSDDFKYAISVVMPLYNVGKYLEEAINSIINQTIGFEENIQLILVNDGSTDNTKNICDKYRSKYPENVVYVEQENAGVSAARNAGIEFVEGKYINFFDGDDKWDINALEIMFEFMESNYETIDFVAGRYCFFGEKSGFTHPLDYKFNSTRIIDIDTDYDFIQLSMATTLIKSTVMKQYTFDTGLKFSEDATLITEILLDKMKYGVVKNSIYYYRKRADNSSAIDSTKKSPEWYFDTPELYFEKVFYISQQKYGKIIKYIQYLVMYDLQWRLKTLMPATFSDEERNLYKSKIISLLKKIDDSVIVDQKNISFVFKVFALSLKHGKNIQKDLRVEEWKVYFRDVQVFSLRGKNILRITNMQIRDDILQIEGKSRLHILGAEYVFKAKTSDDKLIPAEFYQVKQNNVYSFTGETILEGRGFRISIPLKGLKWIKFCVSTSDNYIELSPSFGRFAKINKEQKWSYYAHGDYIVRYGSRKIKIIQKNATRHVLAELRYLMGTVLPNHQFRSALYRVLSFVCRLCSKKEIWILSDRTDMARDNGEALFDYLSRQKNDKHRKVYFVLDKNSVDYERLKKVGKVLKLDSLKYKLLFLQADKIISAHADDWVINAFGDNRYTMESLYDFDYVFLQHGITKDDLSHWLHRFNKNISLFITAVNNEYKSIIDGDYGYTENQVKLTGFPRYDKLVSAPKRKIVILPTWRKNIANPTIRGTSVREYSPEFKNTEYFNFYNSLINDSRLLKVMAEYGFSGEFYIHPAFYRQIEDFSGNDIINVVNEAPDYQRIFKENLLMVTDFSSVAFDFAYMKKPVIYCQFDYDSFFDGHTYEKGYFDYERDGFGPVCYTYEDTIEAIISCIERNCELDTVYNNRVDQFFAWKDLNNCERVYEAIKNMN